jgi:hypothetical protein
MAGPFLFKCASPRSVREPLLHGGSQQVRYVISVLLDTGQKIGDQEFDVLFFLRSIWSIFSCLMVRMELAVNVTAVDYEGDIGTIRSAPPLLTSFG